MPMPNSAVAMILGLYPSGSDADTAARAKLLGPVLRQNELIRAYMRSRRSVGDGGRPSAGALGLDAAKRLNGVICP